MVVMKKRWTRVIARTLLSRSQIDWAKRRLARLVPWNLDLLGTLYLTDKARSSLHGYTEHYARHLQRRRRKVTTVLEIGVGGYDEFDGGSSLRMWRTYFPNAQVIGVDIYAKNLSEPRIVTVQGDQSDRSFLTQLAERFGPFDLIVDDGSHVNEHVLTTLDVLFGAVKPGGTYAIEDVETAYSVAYGGGPPGSPGTSIDFVKSLLDPLNAHRFEDPAYSDGLPRLPVASVHAYPNLVVLEKNDGPSRRRH